MQHKTGRTSYIVHQEGWCISYHIILLVGWGMVGTEAHIITTRASLSYKMVYIITHSLTCTMCMVNK